MFKRTVLVFEKEDERRKNEYIRGRFRRNVSKFFEQKRCDVSTEVYCRR